MSYEKKKQWISRTHKKTNACQKKNKEYDLILDSKTVLISSSSFLNTYFFRWQSYLKLTIF